MNLKYIVFDDGDVGFYPVVFPPWIEHDLMALKFPNYKPISAGFVKVYENELVCYGKSVSLNLTSQESDTAQINLFLK